MISFMLNQDATIIRLQEAVISCEIFREIIKCAWVILLLLAQIHTKSEKTISLRKLVFISQNMSNIFKPAKKREVISQLVTPFVSFTSLSTFFNEYSNFENARPNIIKISVSTIFMFLVKVYSSEFNVNMIDAFLRLL